MKLFPKKEINSHFQGLLKRALKDSSLGWKGSGQLYGFALTDDLFFLLKLQQSASPTRAGFRAITGVGSKRLKERETGKACRLPEPHLSKFYIPTSQPEGLGIPGESWMVLTKQEHAPEQVRCLMGYLESEARDALRENWTSAKFFERMGTHGNPYEFELLTEISS